MDVQIIRDAVRQAAEDISGTDYQAHNLLNNIRMQLYSYENAVRVSEALKMSVKPMVRVLSYLRDDNRIGAIKTLRENFSLGLAEASDIVNEISRAAGL